MIRIEALIDSGKPELNLTLPFNDRTKSRLRTHLDSGEEAGLFLPRGTVLRAGQLLRDDLNRVIQVCAAEEPVSVGRAGSHRLFARACYHLGNRHVPLQVGNRWLRYQPDNVLDEMLIQLGLTVSQQLLPFEPEAGAYGGGHSHHHD
ncbi:MAG TPA: urease accessory protein UreE [Gammaproteobacteria bacterium]|nr:urease accessory protein UreE [Gammaproteobacteria bacterium]